MEPRVPLSELRFNRPEEKLRSHRLLLIDPGGGIWHTSRCHTGKSRQSADREAGLGAHAFIRVCEVECFGVPGL